MRYVKVLVAALVATACVEDGTVIIRDQSIGTDREVAFDSEFTMAVHDMLAVAGTNVLIFFESVTQDSRCPTGVQCPWEGNAGVRLELSSQIAEFAPQPRVLNTAIEPRATDFMGLNIRLVEVMPYPSASGPPIDPASYVVKLIVTRP
ncbi:hypothetical protein BH20GEM1_BH20GEM1_05050 [soil metagenome]